MSDPITIDEPTYQLIGLTESGEIGDLLEGMDAKKSRVRLQALIAEWLRMENLVVLTGAGTSVSAGGKTMADLENSVLSTIKVAADLPASISTIISSRNSAVLLAELDEEVPPTFESWLSYIANALFINQSNDAPFTGVLWPGAIQPTKDEIKWLIDHLQSSIFAECALTLPETLTFEKLASIPPQVAFLSKLVARDSNLGRTHLFTLNYDTLFEQALELLGIQYFDGFSGRAEARFDPSVYGLDIYYPGEVAEGRVRRFDKFLHFYKLHGSVHWFEHENEMRARHPDLTAFKNYGSMSNTDKIDLINKHNDNIPSVGILPTANKFAQTLTMPYAHIFRALQIRLSVSQTFLLVLGYGFGDDHITRILETALMNPSLIMLIVEPNPESSIATRVYEYKDLGKRIFLLMPSLSAFKKEKYKYASFDDFARSIMPDVQWLDDFLRLRRFEKQIASSGATMRELDTDS